MTAKPAASLFKGLASTKGAALLAPAILLFGATLAVGQNQGQPPLQVAQGQAAA